MLTDIMLQNALIGGIVIAAIAGPLGCFVVWRKMSYFGDSLSHSSILGVVLGTAAGISMNLGIVIICLFFAALLTYLQRSRILATDTLLGILAHSALSIGMVMLSLSSVQEDRHHAHHSDEHEHVEKNESAKKDAGAHALHAHEADTNALLFGNAGQVSLNDIILIYAGVCAVFIILNLMWNKLVLTTISEDLAQAEGINTLMVQLLFTIMITITVAVSVRIIGTLLVTSLLIIPAASARQLASSPKQMAWFASVAAMAAVLAGLLLSNVYKTPSGPTIVVCASSIFIMITVLKQTLWKKG